MTRSRLLRSATGCVALIAMSMTVPSRHVAAAAPTLSMTPAAVSPGRKLAVKWNNLTANHSYRLSIVPSGADPANAWTFDVITGASGTVNELAPRSCGSFAFHVFGPASKSQTVADYSKPLAASSPFDIRQAKSDLCLAAGQKAPLDSGMTVTKGQSLRIAATGIATYGAESSACTGGVRLFPQTDAAGNRYSVGACGRLLDPKAPLPSAPVGAVIARVGSGAWLPVGLSSTVTFKAAGRLYLKYNDSTAKDDAGGYDVSFTVPSAGDCLPGIFTDVNKKDSDFRAIRSLSKKGYITGYPKCTFKPAANLTRAQLAKLAVLAFKNPLTDGASRQQVYADVPEALPWYPFIQTVSAGGLMTGYSCGSFTGPCDGANRPYFFPSVGVTRAKMVKLLFMEKHWTPVEPSSYTYEDVLPSDPYFGYVETATAHGVVSGYPCGIAPAGACGDMNRPYFLSSAFVSRGQGTAWVYASLSA